MVAAICFDALRFDSTCAASVATTADVNPLTAVLQFPTLASNASVSTSIVM
jgi:hypothetical protein